MQLKHNYRFRGFMLYFSSVYYASLDLQPSVVRGLMNHKDNGYFTLLFNITLHLSFNINK